VTAGDALPVFDLADQAGLDRASSGYELAISRLLRYRARTKPPPKSSRPAAPEPTPPVLRTGLVRSHRTDAVRQGIDKLVDVVHRCG